MARRRPGGAFASTAAYFEPPDANIDESSGEPPSRISVTFDFIIEEIPETEFEDPENQDAILPINEGDEEEPEPPQPTKFEASTLSELKDLDCAAENNREEWLEQLQKGKRSKRRSSGSLAKRTLSQSIGSDTDDEDLQPVTLLEANEFGSSSRRLRRKVGDRSSLIFDDPPPRIEEEGEGPESCEEVVEVSLEEEEKERDRQSVNRELPYFMQDMDGDPEDD
jgi:hypothetical protein